MTATACTGPTSPWTPYRSVAPLEDAVGVCSLTAGQHGANCGAETEGA